jgi:NAD(P)H dehydrogenase (quinone)
MNYNNKKFRTLSNTENGETSNETLFHYKQVGNILTSEYSGGKIKYGHLIGLVDHLGTIEMRYHQINDMNRLSHHQNVIDAAKETGVQHLIYTSFQRNNETETSPLWMVAQSHIQTEKWLKESGIEYTILRNNLYMDFLPAFIGENVLKTGGIYLPAGQGKVSAVLRSEMAEAAANILTTNGHEGKEYNFSNTEAVSYPEMAQWISEVSGKQINYTSPSAEDYAKTLQNFGVPAEIIGLFSSFAVAQAEGELALVSTDLENLLGRKPTSVKDFLNYIYAAKE